MLSHTRQILPVQSTTIRPLHSSNGVYCSGQRGQVSCTTKGYKDPRQLVGQSQIPPNVSPAYTDLGSSLQELSWLVNKDKSELVPKQVFNCVGYQFDLRESRVRPTQECWQTLQTKIRALMSGPVCPVRKLMSLIGLLIATEKQVHLGRLHMRPIQWHLKKQLDSTGITREGDSHTQVSRPPICNGGWRKAMCSKVKHYTCYNMLCKSLHMHQKKVGALT